MKYFPGFQKKIINFLLLSILLSCFKSEIKIWSPKDLHLKYKKSIVEYTILNFGNIPFGHSIYGDVFTVSPEDACTAIDPIPYITQDKNPILLIKRGNCHFSTKMLNAQTLNAILIIIYDDIPDEDISKIFPVERSEEVLQKLRIPGVIVNNKIGMDLLAHSHDPKIPIQMSIFFKMVQSHEKAEVSVVFQIDDFRSYDFLLGINKYVSKVALKVLFAVDIKISKNMEISNKNNRCSFYSQDIYCVNNSIENTNESMNLSQLSLTHLCLKAKDGASYIEFIRSVRQSCFNSNNEVAADFIECSQKSFSKSVSSKTIDEVKQCDVFGSSESESLLLMQKKINHETFTINYSPLIFINNRFYKGNYRDYEYFMKILCGTFEDTPDVCIDINVDPNKLPDRGLHPYEFFKLSLTICIFIIVLSVLLFYLIYKRKIRRGFSNKLQIEINKALSDYYKNGKKKKNNED